MTETEPRVTKEVRGNVLALGLNRAGKLNAFDLQALQELAEALTEYEDNPELRCAVLFGHGKSFTAGLDLAEVGPAVQSGKALFPDGLVDPLGLRGRRRTKPLVMAVRGWCLTIGIELLLAADIRVAAKDTRFGQIEINRGIFPFGGATLRLPQVAGRGNAMRWLLTGDEFDAEEALRIGLVQQITDTGQELEAALEIAVTVARRAPLGVRATLESAWQVESEGFDAARDGLLVQARKLMQSEDAAEGLRSFVERREADFKGR